MKALGSPWPLAIFAFAAAASSWPSPASAVPLMCQARGNYPSQPVPVQVSFQALVAGGDLPRGFTWDFGDGASSSEQNPSHTYTEAGVFDAVLGVTSSDVPPQTCRDTVVIYAGLFVDPYCLATASARWGDASLAVDFTAYPGLIGDPEPYTWSWRFGDGEISSIQLPTHTYGSIGTYYAVATLHTPVRSYDCYPTLRISAIPPEVTDVVPAARGHNLQLDPARPNPFGVMTVIGFELPRPGRVRLDILDVTGRAVATLVDGYRPAGRHIAVWQGRASTGQGVPAGLYFAHLQHEGVATSRRIARLP